MIVAEAGTSTGNFYFYFRNKVDVFAAALSGLDERISAAIDAAIAQACILIVESSGLSSR